MREPVLLQTFSLGTFEILYHLVPGIGPYTDPDNPDNKVEHVPGELLIKSMTLVSGEERLPMWPLFRKDDPEGDRLPDWLIKAIIDHEMQRLKQQ